MPHRYSFQEFLLAYLCIMLSNAVLYAGPIYRAAAATALGWSQEAAAGAFAMGFLVVIPVPLLTGWVTDRWGAPVVLAAGAMTAALGLLGAATSNTLWQWYTTVGVLLSIGCSTVFNSAALLASTHKRRGSVLGLNSSATGIGLALGSPLIQLLVHAYGWRATLVSAGTILVLLSLAVTRGIAHATCSSTDYTTVAGSAPPLLAGAPQVLCLAGFFVGYVLVAFYDESVYQHVYAYGRALGLSEIAAASIVSAASIAYILGGVSGGVLSDVIGRRAVLVAAALGSAIALLGLAHSSVHLVWGWAVAFGFTLGASLVVRFAAVADLFAGPWLGRAVGVVAPGYWIGAALATYGGAAWLAAGASFRTLYTAAAITALLWAGLSLVLTHPPGTPAKPSWRLSSAFPCPGEEEAQGEEAKENI